MSGLPLDKRFEAAALVAVCALLEQFPELSSVAIVANWGRLPGTAGDSMPAAVWKPSDGVSAPEDMASMQLQLAKTITMLMRAQWKLLSARIEQEHKHAPEPSDKLPDPGGSVPRDSGPAGRDVPGAG